MGERAGEDQAQKEEDEEAALMSQRGMWKTYERLILGLGISALVCLIGLIILRLIGVASMLLFLLIGVQLILIGGLIALRAAVVIARFHARQHSES